MQIHVLYFAAYRDLAGMDAETVDLPDGADGRALVDALRARGGSWSRLPAEPAIAIDREYSPLSAMLRDRSEVALIPPVAGG